MNLTITPGRLSGTVPAIPSKSVAHRLLICAAFADAPTRILCHDTNEDIMATAACLRALGAQITRDQDGYAVSPVEKVPASAVLPCGQSGSTLRFLLPVAGALGIEASFVLQGRLSQRPIAPLWDEMERMGCQLSRPTENTVLCHGQLSSGDYRINAGISSQFVSGLLFAMALLPGRSTLTLDGTIESKPYITMTQDALSLFGVDTWGFTLAEGHTLRSPGTVSVEGDWSCAAFFLAAQALGSDVRVTGLRQDSLQGDRAILVLLQDLEAFSSIDAADIPDLIPILAVVAGARKGAQFYNISRLRLKESDRVESVCQMIAALGGYAQADDNTLTVSPTGYRGGTVDCRGDHRIAMAAATAATVCREPVTILGAECVSKSYPAFWEHFAALGGKL